MPLSKTENGINTYNALAASVGAMSLFDLLPWFFGLLFVLSAIVVNLYGVRTKHSENRVNEAELERKKLEIERLKRELYDDESKS
tara:strand:- start:702 stop:956 length:255 start_codon:yes stop_codon:yes gene_type:complete